MKVRTLIPNIRFRGFSDPWEQRKLESVVIVYDKGRVPVTSTERISGDTPYYGANGIQDYVDGYTHDGEFTLIAEDGANDTRNYPIKFVSGKIWVNNHAHVLAGKQNILNTRFLSFSLQQINIEPFLSGSGRAKLNASEMKKLLIAVPNIYEQIKVENFLGEMAHLIAANEDKVQQLKTLKKLMMQKIFSQEWRFKGFTDPWEQRKLYQIATINPKSVVSPHFLYVDLESVSQNRVTQYRAVTKDNAPSRAQRLAKKGDIFFQNVRPYQKNNLLFLTNKNNVVFSTGYTQIRAKQDIRYLFYTLQTTPFVNRILALSTGTSYPAISSSKLANASLLVPIIDEQSKVGLTIFKIDSLIAANEDKLNQLKRLKKYLMQNLFV